jgi:ElaB/YqjD/DUF883 family membrane-anchored ribosome-binding protein
MEIPKDKIPDRVDPERDSGLPSTQISDASSGSSATDQARQKAQEAAGQAKQKAGSELRSQVDQRTTDAGHRVGGLASDVRALGESLREQGKDQPAKLADQAADRAERLGSYLEESDAERILGDVEDFGRRQPWAVIAGGIAVGLVASRLLKASSIDRYDKRTRIEPRDPVVPAAPAAPATPPAFDASR